MILLDHVTRLYGTVIGANDLNTVLQSGAYGLIGPNGSGKTTLINLLTGNLRPTIGRVEVFGKVPTRRREVLRRIGLCPAADILLPAVSAVEWVAYLTSLHGFRSAEATNRAIASLEQVGMGSDMRRPMGTYSLGMRQRVKLAQAVAHEPDLLILDEPFNGLDPIGRHQMTEFLKKWAADGRSLILASHILHEVEAVTRSFLLIFGGRLLASGEASEVQGMLADLPQEIRVTGQGLEKLASRLIEYDWVDAVQIEHEKNRLVIQAREPQRVLRELTSLVQIDGVALHTVESSYGSLSAAFDALLKRHRGEV
ncbi:MAG: ABC transporter ATP-binding protein [Pirellulales bacterium]